MEQKKTWKWVEPAAAGLFMLLFLTLRILYINAHYDSLNQANELLLEVMPREGTFVSYTLYGCRFVYSLMLEFFFKLFGNKPIVAIYLQVALQGAGILALYFAVRKMIGKIGALFLLAAMALLPYITVASTEQFLLGVFPFYVLLASWLWNLANREERKIGIRLCGAAFLAALIATMSYLDAVGIVFSVVVLTGTVLYTKTGKVLLSACVLAGTTAGYGAVLLTEMLLRGTTAVDTLRQYGDLYFSAADFQVQYLIELSGTPVTLFAAIFLGILYLLLLAVGFWRGNWKQSVLFSLLLFLLAGMKLFHIGTNDYLPLVVISFLILIANGIQGLSVRSRKIEEEEEETESAQEQEEIQEPVKKTRFIENPLPVPKKHVPKHMNYAFEPARDKMKFDLEDISGKDDFDL